MNDQILNNKFYVEYQKFTYKNIKLFSELCNTIVKLNGCVKHASENQIYQEIFSNDMVVRSLKIKANYPHANEKTSLRNKFMAETIEIQDESYLLRMCPQNIYIMQLAHHVCTKSQSLYKKRIHNFIFLLPAHRMILSSKQINTFSIHITVFLNNINHQIIVS